MPVSFPLLERIAHRAATSPDSIAIIDTSTGIEHSYAKLFVDVCAYAVKLEKLNDGEELKERRVGVVAEKGYSVVVALLAVWVSSCLLWK
jgi:acyl-CoA synthetase (AMP-forming)/AMP-acid ligase II